jgi:hypothetical protein
VPSSRADAAGADPGPVDPEAARDAAREILSGAEYAEPEPTLVERAVEWMGERLGSFLGTLTGGGPGSAIGWFVLVILVVGAAWLLVRAARVPRVAATATGGELRYGTETRWDADIWLAEAERLAAAGDHRGALRCRHQAMLARMVDARLVDEAPGRTADEYRRLLGDRRPELGPSLAELTDRFERAWYGGEAVGPAQLVAFSDACRTVESAATRQDVRVPT